MGVWPVQTHCVKLSFDQINTSTGDRELLIGVDKVKPLLILRKD